MPDIPLGRELAFALELADAADALSLARFGAADLRVETKSDLTPVTDADRAVETQLRAMIARERPGQAVLGEEQGDSDLASDKPRPRWVLDPIDGTKNFTRGIPVWGTLIALEDARRRGVVGVISAPALGRRWWAAAGEGAWTATPGSSPRRLQVSAVESIDRAWLSYDSIVGFEHCGLGAAFLDLARGCERTRAFGDFWSHMLVAEGALDVAVEPEVAHWDVAAVAVIVAEAGGTFTDLTGAVRTHGGSAVSTNGRLHRAVLDHLAAGSGSAPHPPPGRG